MIRAIWFLLLTVWMLPQNIVGFCVWLYYQPMKREDGVFLMEGKRWSVSLGWFSFIGSKTKDRATCIKHEKIGHGTQSKILGPLYLPIVGVCSGYNFLTYDRKRDVYYDFWTERWADKLAKIVRT